MRNNKNITIIGAVVVVLVIILGGFGWHHHKQATELNGEWVHINSENDASNLGTAGRVAVQIIEIKGHNYQLKTQYDYRHGRGGKRSIYLDVEHKGTFKLNGKEKKLLLQIKNEPSISNHITRLCLINYPKIKIF